MPGIWDYRLTSVPQAPLVDTLMPYCKSFILTFTYDVTSGCQLTNENRRLRPVLAVVDIDNLILVTSILTMPDSRRTGAITPTPYMYRYICGRHAISPHRRSPQILLCVRNSYGLFRYTCRFACKNAGWARCAHTSLSLSY